MFECKRCKYSARRVRDLRSHLQRKKECFPKTDDCDIPRVDLIKELDSQGVVKPFTCEYCKKMYSSGPILTRHKKICKLANQPIILTQQQLDENYKRILTEFQATQAPSIVINDNSTTNVMNNITYNDCRQLLNCDQRTIDAFYEHIPKEKCIEMAKMKLENIPRKLIEDIFFNDERKENMVIAVLSAKNDQVSIYENGKWCSQGSAKRLMSDLFQILIVKVHEANDSIPREEKINSSIYELVRDYRLGDVTKDIVHTSHYNLYKVEKVHGPIPRT